MNAGAGTPSPPAVRREVVIATSNAGKLREIAAILGDLPFTFRALAEFPEVALPEEGDDYGANAAAKAATVARATRRVALADDSGLEVDGLGGAPGPRSARFGGPGLDDRQRTAALLRAMADCSGGARNARFVCVAALVAPGGEVVTARGECPGRILSERRGDSGFGFDPIFEVEPGTTMAELPPARKNEISHRARALQQLRSTLEALTH